MALEPSSTNPTGTITQVPQLRIAVTVPCGKTCVYCRPAGEGFPSPKAREMSLDEIVRLTAILSRHGISDVKLTGGEPMFRDDLVDMVRELKRLPGIRSVHVVTRHHRAGEIAQELKDAGLDVLNFSIDSLDPHTWRAITGVEGHRELIDAVSRAAETGITIKINTVVLGGVNSDEIADLTEFAGRFGATLKLLDLIDDVPGFPPAATSRTRGVHAFDLDEVVPQFAAMAVESDLDRQPGGLGHPMPRFRMPNGATVLIKSSNEGAWYGPICTDCRFFPCHDALMALRLTADGRLQLCLLRNDNLVDLRSLIDRGAPESEIDRVVEDVLLVYRRAQFYDRDELAAARARGRARQLPVLNG